MSDGRSRQFNPPPGWPRPPAGWVPPKGWTPDPAWPPVPPGWQLWILANGSNETQSSVVGGGDITSAGAPGEQLSDIAERLALLESENARLRAQLASARVTSVVELNDERVLQDVGIYRYHHPLENAVAYKGRLDVILEEIADMVRTEKAIERSGTFTFDGSLAKGQRMTAEFSRLMLRAYNAEADNVVRSLRAGSVEVAIRRLEAARDAIASLGRMMEMHISDAFHALRIEEIHLTADYAMKRQEEREASREERARLREEQKVAAELARERERLDKERGHLVSVIERLREAGAADAELEKKLASVEGAIQRNEYRAANIRAGYVYVISNRGAFGGHIVKIGLTRRLEPMDRINELGDASVPFRFDLHALYFSEDAVTLESELHRHFASRRVNWVNDKREFFFATPGEVRAVLAARVGNLVEFVEECASPEFHQSVSMWPSFVARPS